MDSHPVHDKLTLKNTDINLARGNARTAEELGFTGEVHRGTYASRGRSFG